MLVLALGGFLSATLVRMAPGFGVDEEELDGRLNSSSRAALRNGRRETNLFAFYAEYGEDLFHGELGTSLALHEPVRQLLVERIPETAKNRTWGLAIAWTLGLGVALASGVAVLHRLPLLIADEPTSALDIVTRSEIPALFSKLSRTLSVGSLYISHHLLSVGTISDRAAVMEEGQIVECRPTFDLFNSPAHSYTRKLIAALPQLAKAVNF